MFEASAGNLHMERRNNQFCEAKMEPMYMEPAESIYEDVSHCAQNVNSHNDIYSVAVRF